MKTLLLLTSLLLLSATAYSQNIQIDSQVAGFDIAKAAHFKTDSHSQKEGKLPTVTTRDGLTASVKNCREYIYPIELNSKNVPITWQTANLGVTFHITPHIQDGKIYFSGFIELVAAPSFKLSEKEMAPVITSLKHFSGIAISGTPIKIKTLTPSGKMATLTIILQLIDKQGLPINLKSA